MAQHRTERKPRLRLPKTEYWIAERLPLGNTDLFDGPFKTSAMAYREKDRMFPEDDGFIVVRVVTSKEPLPEKTIPGKAL